MDFNRREVCVLSYYLYQEIIALTCQGALQKLTIEMDRINFAYAKHSNHFFPPRHVKKKSKLCTVTCCVNNIMVLPAGLHSPCSGKANSTWAEYCNKELREGLQPWNFSQLWPCILKELLNKGQKGAKQHSSSVRQLPSQEDLSSRWCSWTVKQFEQTRLTVYCNSLGNTHTEPDTWSQPRDRNFISWTGVIRRLCFHLLPRWAGMSEQDSC